MKSFHLLTAYYPPKTKLREKTGEVLITGSYRPELNEIPERNFSRKILLWLWKVSEKSKYYRRRNGTISTRKSLVSGTDADANSVNVCVERMIDDAARESWI